jgi:ankyrin repeat protein
MHKKVLLLGHGVLMMSASQNPVEGSFIQSISAGSISTVKSFLASGARYTLVNEVDSAGNSALVVACMTGDPALVGLLLEHKAYVGLGKPPRGQASALTVALDSGSLSMVDLLLKHNANTEVRSAQGMTPLMRAALDGNVDLVNILLCTGKVLIDRKVRATWEDRTVRRLTAVQRALLKGGTDCNACAVLLIAYGADVELEEEELDFDGQEAETDGLNLREEVELYNHQKKEFDIHKLSKSVNDLVKAYVGEQTDVLRLCRLCAQVQGCSWQRVVLVEHPGTLLLV